MAGAIDPTISLALEAQTKSFLAELDKRFAKQDAKWEERVSALEKAAFPGVLDVDKLQADLDATVSVQLAAYEEATNEKMDRIEAAATTRVAALESAAAVFDSWRPYIESSVGDVKVSLYGFKAELSRLSRMQDREARNKAPHAGILGEHEAASSYPSPGARVEEPPLYYTEHRRNEYGN